MKVIERIIESEGSPAQKNDLWIHTIGDKSTLEHYSGGKWKPLAGDGGGGGSDPDAVKFTPQELSEEQKEQVKENIGLGAVAYIGNIVGTI